MKMLFFFPFTENFTLAPCFSNENKGKNLEVSTTLFLLYSSQIGFRNQIPWVHETVHAHCNAFLQINQSRKELIYHYKSRLVSCQCSPVQNCLDWCLVLLRISWSIFPSFSVIIHNTNVVSEMIRSEYASDVIIYSPTAVPVHSQRRSVVWLRSSIGPSVMRSGCFQLLINPLLIIC